MKLGLIKKFNKVYLDKNDYLNNVTSPLIKNRSPAPFSQLIK